MREQELLFQVLSSHEMAAEVKHWLDDAFGVRELGDMNKHLNFKPYDPLSFVVTILNFLREDTAPLLAPSVERSQAIDHPSPASALVKESAAGAWKISRTLLAVQVSRTCPSSLATCTARGVKTSKSHRTLRACNVYLSLCFCGRRRERDNNDYLVQTISVVAPARLGVRKRQRPKAWSCKAARGEAKSSTGRPSHCAVRQVC